MTGRTDAWRSLVTVFHTSGWTVLKRMSSKIWSKFTMWFKLLWAFSLTCHDWLDCDAQQSLVHQWRLLSMPAIKQCWHAYVCEIWSNYTMWFRSFEHFNYLLMGWQTYSWVKVFRINPEFRILRLTFLRKSASKFWIRTIIASLISFQIIKAHSII